MHKIRKPIWVGTCKCRQICMSSKFILAMLLMLVFYLYSLQPVINISRKIDVPVNIFESMIYLLCNHYLIFFMFCSWLLLMSDAPYITGQESEIMVRSGKSGWVFGTFFGVMLSGIVFIISVILLTVIFSIGRGYVENVWSDMAYIVANGQVSRVFMSMEVINAISPLNALITGSVLTYLYFCLMVMILLVFNLYIGRVAGFVAVFIVHYSYIYLEIVFPQISRYICLFYRANLTYHYTNDLSGLNAGESIMLMTALIGVCVFMIYKYIQYKDIKNGSEGKI